MMRLSNALSWLESLGLWAVAFALIGLGVFVAAYFLRRWSLIAGALLAVSGLLLAATLYGQSVGSAACEARWTAANYEAQLARAQQEAEAQRRAAQEAADRANEIERQRQSDQQEIADAKAEAARLSKAVAACRTATPADNRRVCRLARPAPAGCPHPR